MRAKLILLITVVMVLLAGCGIRGENDIYKEVQVNSSLTIDILKRASQIIPNKEDLILVFDLSKDWEYYDPHLLFYDSLQRLISASYFPSVRVDSLDANIIYGRLDKVKQKRASRYRSDIPEEYSISLRNDETSNASGRMSNKIIEKVIIQDDLSVTLHVKLSKDKYDGLDLMRSGKISKDNFTLSKVLSYHLSELQFNFSERYVSVIKADMQERLERDIMLFENQSVLEAFYKKLMATLVK